MANANTYKSDVSASLHELASDLHEVGLIDKATMRGFDERRLTPVQTFTAEEIRRLREREQVSQAIFPAYLNVSTTSVSQWECGCKRPAVSTLKLLSLIHQKGLAAIA